MKERARGRGAIFSFAHDEGGQAIVIVVIVTLTMLFAVGLAIDAGQLFDGRRTAQEAADAAAFGGAVVLYQHGTVAQAIDAANVDLSLNNYTTGAATSVTVNVPPASGPHKGVTGYVEVIIDTDVQTALVPQQAGFTRVHVRAVAGTQIIPNLYAIMAIGQTGNNTFTATGGSTLNAVGGGVLVNSNAAGAAATTGGALVVASGQNIDIVGGYSGSGWTPTPTTGHAVQPDPLAGYPKPTIAGLPTQSCCAATIDPGIYPDGISLSSGQAVTMNPGVYIIEKGGINLSANASLTGHGVMLFNTVGNYPGTTGPCGAINFSGDSTWGLSAATSGTYQGMLFFQDPSCNTTVNISGQGAGVSGIGTIYAPTALVSLSGTSGFTINSKIVAREIGISGGASFTVNYDPGKNAQIPIPALVE